MIMFDLLNHRAYYNEFDPKAAAWLRQLINNGLIAVGDVDERSIIDVQASDLVGYTQHHFFAGIGGWSYALRLAVWADDRPVCTASLPCQPFSVSGSGKGKADERHLLPHFLELVRQCRFNVIFGEQVEAAIRHNWLDDLQTNMEAEGYAVGSVVLGAHSVNAPHQRQRLYWVANSNGYKRKSEQNKRPTGIFTQAIQQEKQITGFSNLGAASSSMGNPNSHGPQPRQPAAEAARYRDTVNATSSVGGMGYTEHDGRFTGEKPGSNEKAFFNSQTRKNSSGKFEGDGSPGVISEWDNPDWLYCRDNKYRPIKPGLKPLVNGIPKGMVSSSDSSAPIDADNTQEARVMRLKGYGNAIVPQVAAAFIGEFMEACHV
jgi:DNA (cytosine-5)-methyltransferase 1